MHTIILLLTWCNKNSGHRHITQAIDMSEEQFVFLLLDCILVLASICLYHQRISFNFQWALELLYLVSFQSAWPPTLTFSSIKSTVARSWITHLTCLHLHLRDKRRINIRIYYRWAALFTAPSQRNKHMDSLIVILSRYLNKSSKILKQELSDKQPCKWNDGTRYIYDCSWPGDPK